VEVELDALATAGVDLNIVACPVSIPAGLDALLAVGPGAGGSFLVAIVIGS
jgi:hypothetical protein